MKFWKRRTWGKGKSLCETQGHTFIVTFNDNIKAKKCSYCPTIRTPLTREAKVGANGNEIASFSPD